ncbi:PBP1A family penicillin-binding protein [Anaerobacillus sp. MEB173]|uniref:PBP1A family penicillin-binding protein n=1 Tax=Anaerobacillus sp. MEB173 TaxID=3383345 RepID=UPI003F8FA609
MSDDMTTREGRRKQKELERKKRKEKNKQNKGLLKKIVIIFVAVCAIAIVAGGITVFAMIKDAPSLDPDQLKIAQTSHIYDQSGELVSRLETHENRINVSISEVPQLVEDAFLATEDIRFREHFGIDIRRMFGALRANITSGYFAEGASTITQQVIKNFYLTPDKTIKRKIQEQYLAIKLERMYSKDQILEMYLNQTFFSERSYGVVMAAETYFNKTLDELTIEDAALLAGLPQRPNGYNPIKNPEAAEKRRNIVISLMEKYEKITPEQAEAARAVPVESQLNVVERESYPYESFLDQVIEELETIDGITSQEIYYGGLKVYTTLDPEAQTHVEEVLQTNNYINYPDDDFQAGITLLDTETGEIKAIGGSRQNNNVARALNYATGIKRQPGSTSKPILAYGPVIEDNKWSTHHQIKDEPHTYSNGTPLRNWNNQYQGNVSMREALRMSWNIPAVKAIQEVGTERAEQFASKLGIPFDEPVTEAYAIGGFRTGVSSLDLAGAYAAFGNEGVYHKPHTVRKVVFPDGREINNQPESVIAMSDYTAYMISDMLKTVVNNGTGTQARISGLPVAGKTGSTNFTDKEKQDFRIPNGAVRDVWFAGYTTKYTAAVWTGYSKLGENHFITGNNRNIAQLIFKHVMEDVSSNVTTPDFKQPDSVVRVGIERGTGLLPSAHTPSSQIMYELFVRGTEPQRVSQVYNKPTTPQDLVAGYNEDTDQIMLSWGYPPTELSGTSFKIVQTIDGGESTVLTVSSEMQHIIFSPTAGSTYQFSVIAVHNDMESNPATVQVSVPGIQEEEIPDPVEELPPPEEDEDQQRDEDERRDEERNRENERDRGRDRENDNENRDEGDSSIIEDVVDLTTN